MINEGKKSMRDKVLACYKRPDFKGSDKSVMIWLMANIDDVGIITAKLPDIAGDVNLTERTTRSSLDRLQELGLVERLGTNRGEGVTGTVYRVRAEMLTIEPVEA
jgi:predicted transcriptional regulator